ncbi:MAG: O-antigen ligase family protein [Xanthomonadaceae bacterium]|nr:O-antigen ligase family protein [Xanthomonadaceae bacterium]
MLELARPEAGWWRTQQAPAVTGVTVDRQPKGTVAYRATMAFLFILVIAPQQFITPLQPLRIAFITAALAIGAFLLQRIIHREPLIEAGPEVRVVGLIIAWGIVTVPFSIWPGGSVQFLVSMYLKSVALFLLLAHVVDTRDRMVKTAWALTLMAVPLALIGVKNFLTGAGGAERITGYEGGLTANPNDLALMLNLLLPLAIAVFLGARKRSTQFLLAGVIVLMVTGVVVTFSRSGFLTLALIGVVYGWMMMRRRQNGLVFAAAIALLVSLPLVPTSYVERLATITSIEADETGSSRERWSDSLAAVEFIGSNPVAGGGLGQSALAMNQMRGDRWLRVHNVYLEAAVELGLPGLILIVLLIYRCAGAARLARAREAANNDDPRFYYVAEGIWVSLIAFAFAGLFYPAAYHFYFYLLAGLALAARSITREGA